MKKSNVAKQISINDAVVRRTMAEEIRITQAKKFPFDLLGFQDIVKEIFEINNEIHFRIFPDVLPYGTRTTARTYSKGAEGAYVTIPRVYAVTALNWLRHEGFYIYEAMAENPIFEVCLFKKNEIWNLGMALCRDTDDFASPIHNLI